MLCVIAKLPESAAEKLDGLRKAVVPDAAAKAPLYGHITLATYLGNEEEWFIRSCRESLTGFPAFEIEYDQLGVLEASSIVVALPQLSEQLASLHRRLTEGFESDLDNWTRDETWVPHTTLFYGPGSDLQGICRSMESLFTPFRAVVNTIEFSRVLEAGFEILGRMDLPLIPPQKG